MPRIYAKFANMLSKKKKKIFEITVNYVVLKVNEECFIRTSNFSSR